MQDAKQGVENHTHLFDIGNTARLKLNVVVYCMCSVLPEAPA